MFILTTYLDIKYATLFLIIISFIWELWLELSNKLFN